MNNIKHKLLKLCVLSVCVIILSLLICNKDEFSAYLEESTIPYIQSKLFPKSVSLQKINSSLVEMVNLEKSVQTIVLYKFNKDPVSNMIMSQEGVAFKNRYPKRKLSNYMYLIDKKNNTFQDLLMNKVHFDNIYTANNECSPNYNIENFSCLVVTNTRQTNDTVVTIPVVNTKGYEVIGYVMITVDKSYNKYEVQNLVNNIKDQLKSVSTEMNKL